MAAPTEQASPSIPQRSEERLLYSDGRFSLQWLDFEGATAADRSQIDEVYQLVFRDDIGIAFDPSLDADCQAPTDYYSDRVRGAYLVVRDDATGGRIVGTAGLRALPQLPGRQAELKRMFFLPVCRGRLLGHRACDVLLRRAAELGYDAVVLDTKRTLIPANRVYEAAGFVDCENYNGNPRADRFMRKLLR